VPLATTEPVLTILDIVYAINSPEYADKINVHPGSRVLLVGFVVKGAPSAPPDGFVLTRFLVTCCVADAIPIGVRVSGAAAQGFADNTWVSAEGTVTWTSGGSLRSPSRVLADLTAEKIEPVARPADPYVY
jgi:uncharacterized repeat protein (TIGR03943 family)